MISLSLLLLTLLVVVMLGGARHAVNGNVKCIRTCGAALMVCNRRDPIAGASRRDELVTALVAPQPRRAIPSSLPLHAAISTACPPLTNASPAPAACAGDRGRIQRQRRLCTRQCPRKFEIHASPSFPPPRSACPLCLPASPPHARIRASPSSPLCVRLHVAASGCIHCIVCLARPHPLRPPPLLLRRVFPLAVLHHVVRTQAAAPRHRQQHLLPAAQEQHEGQGQVCHGRSADAQAPRAA